VTRVVMLVGKATGGIGVHVRDLAAGLAAAGTEVAIVTDPLTARTFGLGGARLLWPDPRRPDPRRLGELRRLLRGADVVHAHGHQAGLVAAFALGPRPRRARSRPAFVISLHNEVPLLRRPLRPVIERAERTAMRRADLVTGASADLVAAARGLGARHTELAAVPSPRVAALLAAGPAERAAARERVTQAHGVAVAHPLIVTISRIAPQKDLPTLVAASAEVRTRHTWLVAGGGVERLLSQVRSDVASRGLPVRFLGPVAAPDDLLLAADLFVLTSTWEARALVVQEAMAAGVPVIAADVGGLPDLLGEGGGVLVPARDPGAFARAIDDLLVDPGLRDRLGQTGRRVAAEWPDLAATTRWWTLAYDRLIREIA